IDQLEDAPQISVEDAIQAARHGNVAQRLPKRTDAWPANRWNAGSRRPRHYLQGIGNAEIIETVHARRAPMIPVSTSPRLRSDSRVAALLVARAQATASRRAWIPTIPFPCTLTPRQPRGGSGLVPGRHTPNRGSGARILVKTLITR